MARRKPLSRRTVPLRRARKRTEPVVPPPPLHHAQVVLDLEVERGRVHLVLANCGDGVATDVRVEFSRRLDGIEASIDLSRLPIFRRLGVLRPGCLVRVFWDATSALLSSDDRAAPFKAVVSWAERFSSTRQRAEYEHDLSIYRQLPQCVEH